MTIDAGLRLSPALRGRLVPLMRLWPGLALALTIAMSAGFLADHYGGSAFLYALLVGLALSSLKTSPALEPGLHFSGKRLLRLGVALLGTNIGLAQAMTVGLPTLLGIFGLVLATIACGLFAARLARLPLRLGILSGGATAICGASAALAIAAVLPASPERDRDAAFTVICVTLLSTVAMALYPVVAALAGWDATMAGIFIGATIHDVAQVVGAGYSISPIAGDTAVLVKLFRVGLLVPVVSLTALVVLRAGRNGGGQRPSLPGFLVAFVLLATLCSVGLLPDWLKEASFSTARGLLLTAVAATGMRIEIADFLAVGRHAMLLVLLESVFLAALAAVCFSLLR